MSSRDIANAIGFIVVAWGVILAVTVIAGGIHYAEQTASDCDPSIEGDCDNAFMEPYTQSLPEEIWDGVSWFIWLGYMTVAVIVCLAGVAIIDRWGV